jgi:hypothetical protein
VGPAAIGIEPAFQVRAGKSISKAGREARRRGGIRSATMWQQMPLMNAIARLIRKLRSYLRDAHRSRQELTDSISSENVLPPIPPPDGKRLK